MKTTQDHPLITNRISEYRKTPYRPEIDGLRAVSVLGVVLYHFQLGVPGGFVGVDVFFVISGYLITSIIVREIESGSFSIRNFWARRIRRIFPAASLLGVSVLLAGIFILGPDPTVNLAKSSLAQTFIVSNVYFWKEAGYFTSASELKPLLHTWSLSIEEQFYVCLPIGLLLIVKFLKRGITPFLVFALLLSLGLSIYGAYRSPEATFYLLPTRAWELLAGSVAAVAFKRLTLSRPMANLLSVLGLLMVVLPMLLYSNQTRFPGLNAVPPVFGSALFIVANSGSNSLAGRILSLRPVVFVGLISYSLYLWHWPVFSFSRHMLIETDGKETIMLLALTLILSILSWKFVETPFRHTNRLRENGQAFLFASAVSSLLLIVSSCLIAGKGFTGRFDTNTTLIMEDVYWTGSEYKEEIGDPVGGIRFGRESKSPPDFVLWGDSHAMVLGETVETLSSDLGLNGVGFITPACPPVPGLWMPGDFARSREDVLTRNKMRLDWVIDQHVKNVILVGRWEAMCGEKSEAATIPAGGVNSRALMVVDSTASEVNREASTAALRRQLSQMVSELNDHGVKVWILVQVPEIFQTDLAKDFSLKHRFPRLNDCISNESPSLEEYQNQRRDSLDIFQSLEHSNAQIVDPADAFFSEGLPFELFDSRAFYRDDNHLTRRGANRFLKPLIAEIFGKILESRQ
jgi:peptidoglycan/LPS O-acetylase OafA/YrhL